MSAELTPYEAEQVHAIAAWKADPPHPVGELFKRITHPLADMIEKAIPDTFMRTALDRAYTLADGAAVGTAPSGQPLEISDAAARRIGSTACAIAVGEGAVTGAGGFLTTLADVPLLFVLSLGTIIRIGRSYGYQLEHERERKYVLGVLIAAISGSLEVRLDRLHQLRDIEQWFLEETQEEILTEEAAALLFQLEIFDVVPAVGAISGGLLNLLFIRRVELTARRVFQERTLREQSKVDVIAPAAVRPHVVAPGWGGVFGRLVHATGYAVGYTVAFPLAFAAALLQQPTRRPQPVAS
jgi:hypothetical protein